MNKELHERALSEATLIYEGFIDDEGQDTMEQAIAAYLRTAGLTVVPLMPNVEMKDAVRNLGGPQAVAYGLASWSTFLDTFPSPFKEVKL